LRFDYFKITMNKIILDGPKKYIKDKNVNQILFDMESTHRKNCKTNSSQLNKSRVEELVNNEFPDIFVTNNKPSKATKVSHFINTTGA
jgi:hypothetical protein